MGNVDLSKYYQLEQLSQYELNILEQAIVDVCFKKHVVENIFIMGSFVFGLDKINDIDIAVCIKEYVDQDSLDKDNVRLYKKFQVKYSNKLSKKFNIKIQLLPFNMVDFLTCEAQKAGPPLYDLTNKIWINKEPGDIFPFHLVKLDNGKVVLMERDGYTCKKKSCTCD